MPGASRAATFAFFGPGGAALLAGRTWPRPAGDAPGEWIERNDAFPVRGYVAQDLPYWLDDELWLVELDGEVTPDDHALNADRGRLLEPVSAWTATVAWEFVAACATRTRRMASSELRDAGQPTEAEALDAATDDELVAVGDAVAQRASGLAAELAMLTADCVRYAQDAPNHGAAAAVAGYLAAHAAGRRACDYESGAEGERAWQARWFAERLGLTAAAAP